MGFADGLARRLTMFESIVDSKAFQRVGFIFLVVNAVIGMLLVLLSVFTNLLYLLTLVLESNLFAENDNSLCTEISFQVVNVMVGVSIFYYSTSSLMRYQSLRSISVFHKLSIFTPLPTWISFLLFSLIVNYIAWSLLFMRPGSLGLIIFLFDIFWAPLMVFLLAYVAVLLALGVISQLTGTIYAMARYTLWYRSNKNSILDSSDFMSDVKLWENNWIITVLTFLRGLKMNFDAYSDFLPKYAVEMSSKRILRNGRKLIDFIFICYVVILGLIYLPASFGYIQYSLFAFKSSSTTVSPMMTRVFLVGILLGDVIIFTDYKIFAGIFMMRHFFKRIAAGFSMIALLLMLASISGILEVNEDFDAGDWFFIIVLLYSLILLILLLFPVFLYIVFVRYRKLYISFGYNPDEWNAKEGMRWSSRRGYVEECKTVKYPLYPEDRDSLNVEMIASIEENLVKKKEAEKNSDYDSAVVPLISTTEGEGETFQSTGVHHEVAGALKVDDDKGSDELEWNFYYRLIDDEAVSDRVQLVSKSRFRSVLERHPKNQIRPRVLFLYLSVFSLCLNILVFSITTGKEISADKRMEGKLTRMEPIFYILVANVLQMILFCHSWRNLGDSEDFVWIYSVHLPLSLLLLVWQMVAVTIPYMICFTTCQEDICYCDLRFFMMAAKDNPPKSFLQSYFVTEKSSLTITTAVNILSSLLTIVSDLLILVALMQDVYNLLWLKRRRRMVEEEDV